MERCRVCFTVYENVYILDNIQQKDFLGSLFTKEGINEQLDWYLICYECKALLKKSTDFIQKVIKAQRAFLVLQFQDADKDDVWTTFKNELGLNSTLSYHRVEVTLSLKDEENLLHEDEIEFDELSNKVTTFEYPNENITYKKLLSNDGDCLEEIQDYNLDLNTENGYKKIIKGKVEDTIENHKDTKSKDEDKDNLLYEDPNTKLFIFSHEDEVECIEPEYPIVDLLSSDDDNIDKIQNYILDEENAHKTTKTKKREESIVNHKNKKNKHDDDIDYKPNQPVKKKKKIYNDTNVKRIRKKRTKDEHNFTEINQEFIITEQKRSVKENKYVESEDEEIKKAKDEEFTINSEISSSESEASYDSYDDNGKRLKRPPREYPRQCDHCVVEIQARRFHYHHYLNNHSHDMYPYLLNQQKLFICQHCGSEKRNKTELLEHEKTHTGKRDVLCPDCGKAYYNKKHLLNHKFRAHGESKYVCDYCKKGFHSRADLTRHIRIHTGEKPFKCDICGVSYATRGNLTLHLKKGAHRLDDERKRVSKKSRHRKRNHSSTDDDDDEDDDYDTPVIPRQRRKRRVKNTKENNEDNISNSSKVQEPLQEPNDYENDIPLERIKKKAVKKTKKVKKRVKHTSNNNSEAQETDDEDDVPLETIKKTKIQAKCNENTTSTTTPMSEGQPNENGSQNSAIT